MKIILTVKRPDLIENLKHEEKFVREDGIAQCFHMAAAELSGMIEDVVHTEIVDDEPKKKGK
jgi:hypothetical protein